MIATAITLIVVAYFMAMIYTFLFMNASVIITPVKGIMIGACYEDDEGEYDDTEHTIQLSLGIIIITVIWVTEN